MAIDRFMVELLKENDPSGPDERTGTWQCTHIDNHVRLAASPFAFALP
jgi:hypothetical protein